MKNCKYALDMACLYGSDPTDLICCRCIDHNFSNGVNTKIADPPKHKCYENCYFYKNFCGDIQWCRYKSEQDPNCEGCHAYRTQTQVDILVKLAIEEANNEANKMTFGKRLRMLRICKGLTQEQMAEKLGISRRSYIPYEQDKSRPRNKATYQMMADILDCDITFLLNEEELK